MTRFVRPGVLAIVNLHSIFLHRLVFSLDTSS